MNTYKELPWPKFRNDLKDFLDLGRDRNIVHGISEADITKVSEIFKAREREGIKSNSLIGYLIWCIGQAIRKHPEIQAIKKGQKLILFDDVDIAIMIEKDLPGGSKIPFPYIFRSVQNKSYGEINIEMQNVKKLNLAELRKKKKSLIIRSFPRFLRMWILKKHLKDPLKAKEVLGTVALTSLGMVLSNRRFWPVPLGPYPCTIASGATFTRKESDGERKILCLTISIDHNLSDGAPVARFGQTLVDLIEAGEGVN